MKGAVISLGSVSSRWIYEEMKNFFDEVDFLDLRKFEAIVDHNEPKLLHNSQELGDYDCVYVRGSFKYAKLLCSISSILELNGAYLPLEPSVFTNAHDKLLTHLCLQKHKVPMPKTYLVPNVEVGKQLLKRIKYPIVMKFPDGTHGKGVMFAESFASASALVDAFTALKQPFLLQEFIDSEGGEDYRIIVVGDEIAACMKRRSMTGENRSNFHLGGKCEAVEINDDFKRVAVAAAKSLKADILAIDIMESIKGPVVIEVNSSPGLQGITAATKINIAEKMARFLAEKTARHKQMKGGKLIAQLSGKEDIQRLATNLKVRGGKLVLPEFVTDITSFREDEELIFNAEKGKLTIERI